MIFQGLAGLMTQERMAMRTTAGHDYGVHGRYSLGRGHCTVSCLYDPMKMPTHFVASQLH
jgi:hypothetical protein